MMSIWKHFSFTASFHLGSVNINGNLNQTRQSIKMYFLCRGKQIHSIRITPIAVSLDKFPLPQTMTGLHAHHIYQNYRNEWGYCITGAESKI